MPRRLTAADICTVTGYSRDELNATLKVLRPYSEWQVTPRIAREFNAHDLIVLCVTSVLEHRFGMRRTAVAKLGPSLRIALAGPKVVSKKARLVVTVDPVQVEYVDMSITEKEGVVVALGPIFAIVDKYMAARTGGVVPKISYMSTGHSRTG